MQAAGRGQAPDDRSRRAGWRPAGTRGAAEPGARPRVVEDRGGRREGARADRWLDRVSTRRSRVATELGEEAEQTNSSRTAEQGRALAFLGKKKCIDFLFRKIDFVDEKRNQTIVKND